MNPISIIIKISLVTGRDRNDSQNDFVNSLLYYSRNNRLQTLNSRHTLIPAPPFRGSRGRAYFTALERHLLFGHIAVHDEMRQAVSGLCALHVVGDGLSLLSLFCLLHVSPPSL